jgi:transposase
VVDKLKESGYSVKAICESIGISRSSYYKQKKGTEDEGRRGQKDKDFSLIERIKELCLKHPFLGIAEYGPG